MKNTFSHFHDDFEENIDDRMCVSFPFRCGLCHKLLTKDTERRISCVPGKIYIDAKGEIAYSHIRLDNPSHAALG